MLHATLISSLSRRIFPVLLAVAGGGLLLAPNACHAQSTAGPGKDLTLETKDGVLLQCTWYAGSKAKKSVPVILVHGIDGQRKEWDRLAEALNKEGHAVISVDLRGHGESQKRRDAAGTVIPYIPIRNPKLEYATMVRFDMEAVKAHLMKEHNAGNLNIELLTVIGSEGGAAIGFNWCIYDWQAPLLAGFKQGQDARAMIMISPEQNVKGFAMETAKWPVNPLVNPPTAQISTMILVGKKGSSAATARRLNQSLERVQVANPPADQKLDKQDLYYFDFDTPLKGTKMLQPALNLERYISRFIELRLIKKEMNYPWKERPNPLAPNN